MRAKTLQVTCNCSSYKFPHRIDGGRCNASEWCESYKVCDGSLCNGCSCLNNSESGAQGERFNSCDVEQGLESVTLCEGYQDHLHSQTVIRFPMALNDWLSTLVDDRYGDYAGAF